MKEFLLIHHWKGNKIEERQDALFRGNPLNIFECFRAANYFIGIFEGAHHWNRFRLPLAFYLFYS